MADDNKIGLEAIFETEEFQQALKAYNSSVADSTKATEDSADSMGGAWDGLASIGGAAWGAVAAAIAGATAEMYLAIDAASESEDVMAALDFQLQKSADNYRQARIESSGLAGSVDKGKISLLDQAIAMGITVQQLETLQTSTDKSVISQILMSAHVGITKDQVLGLADSMSKVTPFDDEVIVQAATLGMRFDGVNKDNLQPLLKAAADLAVSTGKELPSTMKELSLAITDPAKAMRLLRDADITLDASQQKQLTTWAKTGDSASATSFLLEELNSRVGGLAETMGTTASGKMEIMQTALGNLQEDFGGGLLEAMKGVFDKITEFADDPKTISFFTNLGTTIGDFALTVVDNMPSIMTAIQTVFTWLQNNQPVIVGVLAVIAVAMYAFAASAVTAFLATAEISVPLIAAIAAIGIVSALLFKAWTEDWGGIREKVQAAYQQIKPVLDQLQAWLGVNMPIAIKFLSDVWTQVLLPAIQAVFGWWADNVLPILVQIVLWLATNVPAAIQAVSGFFTGTLIPVLSQVWGFISKNIIPSFVAVSRLLTAVVGVAVRILAGIWQNILLPAITKVSSWISEHLSPAFDAIGKKSGEAQAALAPFATFLKDVLGKAFDSLQATILIVNQAIQDMADALNNLTLPAALTPGSPTPFEIGLKGINAELDKLAGARLPAVATQFKALGDVRAVQNAPGTSTSNNVSNSSQTIRNYLYGSKFEVRSKAGLLEILNGLQ